jgi:hypothetical protein
MRRRLLAALVLVALSTTPALLPHTASAAPTGCYYRQDWNGSNRWGYYAQCMGGTGQYRAFAWCLHPAGTLNKYKGQNVYAPWISSVMCPVGHTRWSGGYEFPYQL